MSPEPNDWPKFPRSPLQRLEQDLQATGASTVVCLGDTFDDTTAMDELTEAESLWIARMQAGRKWIWIEGNHDPGPVMLGGSHLAAFPLPPLVFRHIAQPGSSGELSGHYHPKARIRARGHSLSRPCFLVDSDRVVLPSYGTYTGGLRSNDQVLTTLMSPEALAISTGPAPRAIPMPR